MKKLNNNKHWSLSVLAIAGLFVCMSLSFTNSKTATAAAVVTSTTATTAKSMIEEKMPLFEI